MTSLLFVLQVYISVPMIICSNLSGFRGLAIWLVDPLSLLRHYRARASTSTALKPLAADNEKRIYVQQPWQPLTESRSWLHSSDESQVSMEHSTFSIGLRNRASLPRVDLDYEYLGTYLDTGSLTAGREDLVGCGCTGSVVVRAFIERTVQAIGNPEEIIVVPWGGSGLNHCGRQSHRHAF